MYLFPRLFYTALRIPSSDSTEFKPNHSLDSQPLNNNPIQSNRPPTRSSKTSTISIPFHDPLFSVFRSNVTTFWKMGSIEERLFRDEVQSEAFSTRSQLRKGCNHEQLDADSSCRKYAGTPIFSSVDRYRYRRLTKRKGYISSRSSEEERSRYERLS